MRDCSPVPVYATFKPSVTPCPLCGAVACGDAPTFEALAPSYKVASALASAFVRECSALGYGFDGYVLKVERCDG